MGLAMKSEEIIHFLESRPLPPLVPRSAFDERVSAHIARCDCPAPVKAGLLLWNDDLDAAHRMAQQIETTTGSYWHAIMHRREPDYGNSKYWFNRVGRHPAMARLAEQAAPLFKGCSFLANGRYDAFAFVDACELREGKPDQKPLAEFQLLEIRILLAYCLADE